MRRLTRVLGDREKLAAFGAELFADVALASTGVFRVALSGGNTPRALYAKLSEEPLRARVPWDRLDVFFGDERCVPTDSSESNYRMAADALLSRVPVRPERVHRVQTEMPPEEAARRYARELSGPRFDWVFLGLGEDGHTASLFPGTPAVTETHASALAVEVAWNKAWRVSLTLPVINAAKKCVFLVSGKDKAETVRRVLEEPATPDLPATLVAPKDGEILWLLDRPAASRLTKPSQA